jgi:hypothetical protein
MDLWEYTAVSREQVDGEEFEEAEEEFRPVFRKNHKKIEQEDEVPRHPYKIFRDLVTSNRDLDSTDRIVIEALKDEYSEKWREKVEEAHGDKQ